MPDSEKTEGNDPPPIESVVGATWSDLNDLGSTIDTMAGDTESIKKILIKLHKNQVFLQDQIKQTIAAEVAKQIAPLVQQLNNFTTTKPKFIYVRFKFPNPFKWLYNKFKK